MSLSRPALWIFLFAVVNGLIAQALEAYSAHGLVDIAGDYAPTLFHMSAKYQMWHVLALGSIALLYDRIGSPLAQKLLLATAIVLGVATVLFCVGMYGVSFGVSVYYAAVGGGVFQLGWGLFIISIIAALVRPTVKPGTGERS